MELLALLFACHFIGDYPFQSVFFVENKGKSWEINFYHAATYTAAFVVFAHVSVPAALLLLVSHFLIDPVKARWHIIPVDKVWIDQLLHCGVILVIWGLGL
jgi:Protein of unknown function (DUF3307)